MIQQYLSGTKALGGGLTPELLNDLIQEKPDNVSVALRKYLESGSNNLTHYSIMEEVQEEESVQDRYSSMSKIEKMALLMIALGPDASSTLAQEI